MDGWSLSTSYNSWFKYTCHFITQLVQAKYKQIPLFNSPQLNQLTVDPCYSWRLYARLDQTYPHHTSNVNILISLNSITLRPSQRSVNAFEAIMWKESS